MTPPPDRPLRLESRGPTSRRAQIPTERELSLRARLAARDERALAELIELTTPWLLGVAQAMLQDADDAEDVVMDTFRVLWNTITPAADDTQGLMPLLLRMTRQRAIDRLRSRRRRVRLVSALTPLETERAAVPAVEPNEAATPGWHVHAQVHAALASLPPDQRAAVSLAYFEGLAQSEIAVALGIPLGTVKTRIRLAFGRLRESLAPLKDWVP
jgi:RNA polymerase sigma-70 factor, ECF subfamily